jgi:hypothetical protein
MERDHPSGKIRIRASVFGMMPLWDGPDFRPDRRYHAFDPSYQLQCLNYALQKSEHMVIVVDVRQFMQQYRAEFAFADVLI